jgi:hypothetical protein
MGKLGIGPYPKNTLILGRETKPKDMAHAVAQIKYTQKKKGKHAGLNTQQKIRFSWDLNGTNLTMIEATIYHTMTPTTEQRSELLLMNSWGVAMSISNFIFLGLQSCGLDFPQLNLSERRNIKEQWNGPKETRKYDQVFVLFVWLCYQGIQRD